jgi:hypothetical protein
MMEMNSECRIRVEYLKERDVQGNLNVNGKMMLVIWII